MSGDAWPIKPFLKLCISGNLWLISEHLFLMEQRWINVHWTKGFKHYWTLDFQSMYFLSHLEAWLLCIMIGKAFKKTGLCNKCSIMKRRCVTDSISNVKALLSKSVLMQPQKYRCSYLS